MSDEEKLTSEAEDLAPEVEEQVERATDEVGQEAGQAEDLAPEAEDRAEQAPEAAEKLASEADEQAAAEADEVVDERVEAAVRHVAEEAQAEAEPESEPAGGVVEEPTAQPEPAPKKRERRSKQARAEKASREGDPVSAKAASGTSLGGKLASLGVSSWLGIAAACLVLGLLLGRFALGGSAAGGASLGGKTTVSEAELDDVYAVYTYAGKTNTITVREVIEQNGTLDAAKAEDGSYTVPAAEYAVNAARTAILNAEVDSRGIEVSDEDVASYAEKALGTSDFDAIASTYGMDADAVKKLITANCRLNALREQVLGSESPEAPVAPQAAEKGKEGETTKEYADYIIGLAGDEWDSEKGAWKSGDSAYATALDGLDFSADSASYNAAQAAYYVAYQQYSEKQAEMSGTWTEFVNGLMSQASIQVGTLLS